MLLIALLQLNPYCIYYLLTKLEILIWWFIIGVNVARSIQSTAIRGMNRHFIVPKADTIVRASLS